MKVEHGGNAAALAEEFGFSLEDCLDFSANINPLGISQKLRACLTESIGWFIIQTSATATPESFWHIIMA